MQPDDQYVTRDGDLVIKTELAHTAYTQGIKDAAYFLEDAGHPEMAEAIRAAFRHDLERTAQ